MTEKRYRSWGRYPNVEQRARRIYWCDELPPTGADDGRSLLPFGNGRSYGDVCLNDGGTLLDCRKLDRFIHFDVDTGVLRCEAGVLLSEILRLAVPRGWFLPVTPGTQLVTVGGAIANDVHGKNHHRAGTFGRHVRRFELFRSDGTRLTCSPEDNAEYYSATISGLGLTGVICWAEIQLVRINNPYIEQETIRYRDLAEFFALARESDRGYEHTVAWVDCMATGAHVGRGLFIRGNHAGSVEGKAIKRPGRRLRFPVDPPRALVNGLTLKLFNSLYYRKQRSARKTEFVHYERFFYPLDAIHAWNRVYGAKGFFQYQCVIPLKGAEDAIREMLERVAAAGLGSFLAVLKLFGDRVSPGLLSFPMPGATIALDFPNTGPRTFQLLDRLDEVLNAAGGRINPSKDARMQPQDFRRNYPQWRRLEACLDPRFSSSFWRRVTAQS